MEFPLARALKRERVGANREAMGRVRVGRKWCLECPHTTPSLRAASPVASGAEEGSGCESDPQRLGHQAVEVVHRMLADLAALGIDDEAALAVAPRGEPALHGFADP